LMDQQHPHLRTLFWTLTGLILTTAPREYYTCIREEETESDRGWIACQGYTASQ
jgi:hypothetical protein